MADDTVKATVRITVKVTVDPDGYCDFLENPDSKKQANRVTHS